LTTGIASALRSLSPETRIIVCEPETGAPVTAALANDGAQVPVEFTPSFVDGAGSGALLPEMWEHARPLVSEAAAVSLEAAAATIRMLLERARIVAEGAAALTVAAALAGKGGTGRVVCIVSGGNIDARRLAAILDGRVPD
jgi:threonine dehydratase